MGSAAQPADIAPAHVFLASAESSFVVGETLNVKGGMVTPLRTNPSRVNPERRISRGAKKRTESAALGRASVSTAAIMGWGLPRMRATLVDCFLICARSGRAL